MAARRRTSALRRVVAVLLALALLGAACGEDGQAADEPEGQAEGAAAPAATEPADGGPATATPSPDPSPDDAPEAEETEQAGSAERGQQAQQMVRLEGITTTEAYDAFGEGLARWQAEVPGIQDVRIPSSADDNVQPALWLPPAEEGRPLLVTFHTWSTPYRQHVNIPLARWAQQMGWAVIQPNFRGVNDKPEATGSDLAVQDVVDAIDFALAEADLDEERVYGIGFSGGGMMSLLLAGRRPDRFAGLAAWTPNHDLIDWYVHHVQQGDDHYPGMIEASCGGDPTADEAARESCWHRSPAAHLDRAREAGVPVYIAHGLHDDNVTPDQGARAFNQLADEEDRLSEDALAAIRGSRLSPDLQGQIDGEHFFTEAEPEVFLARRSGAATLVLFDGGHDMVYHPALEWMVRGAAAP